MDKGFTDVEADAFVRQWLDLSEDNGNFDAVMNMYAGTVDFFKKGAIDRSAVAKDKRSYFNRWPEREHRLLSIAIRPAVRAAEKQVDVVFHYRIRRGKKMLEGDAGTFLLLRKVGQKIVIFSEKAKSATVSENEEYLVWPGSGRTLWIDSRGRVLKQSKKEAPIIALNGTVYSAQIDMRKVKQVDCTDPAFMENEQISPPVKDARDRQLTISAVARDGRERSMMLIAPQETDAGEGETTIEILGDIGPWLFVERSVYFFPCGGVHGAGVSELLIVDLETFSVVPAYSGQGRSGVESDILGEGTVSASSGTALFTGGEYHTLLSALENKAVRDIQSDGEPGDLRLTRVRPVVKSDTMALEVLLTMPTSYASSDGKWSAYTRSRSYRSPVVPATLRPYRTIPQAVLQWRKKSRKNGYPSWSVVPHDSMARQQLEKLF